MDLNIPTRYCPQQAAIKQALEKWRSEVIARNGLNAKDMDMCAQNSRVIHDIFIDAIAKNAENIRSPQDLYSVAYYWNWVDQYGLELYSQIEEYLQSPKRVHDRDSNRRKRLCV